MKGFKRIQSSNRKVRLLRNFLFLLTLLFFGFCLNKGLNVYVSCFYSIIILFLVFIIMRNMYWVEITGDILGINFINPFKRNWRIDCQTIVDIKFYDFDDDLSSLFIKGQDHMAMSVMNKDLMEISRYYLSSTNLFDVSILFSALEIYLRRYGN